MEIEFSRRLLIGTACALTLILMGLVGLAASPRDADGHPLLLSPQRRAILHYLNWCRGWAGRLADLEDRLDGLMPAADDDLQPAPSPGDLYQRAQRAGGALRAASALQLEAERAAVPPPMVAVHGLVTAAAQAHTAWAEAVVAYIGAPSPEAAVALAGLRQDAVDALGALQGVLSGAD